MAVTTSSESTAPPRVAGHRHLLPDALAWGALAALALWALAPVVYLVIRAGSGHETWSGADSLFAADQLQYLAWIRSSGEHLLAANGFALRVGGHVYLQPMFAISGLLWRFGMSIALSYLVWLPVAVAVLYTGFRRFIWYTLSGSAARAAALILALFFVTPAASLLDWTAGSAGLANIAGQLAPSGALYGYFPTAIAAGLLALFMVGVDLIVQGKPESRRIRPIAMTAAAGAVAAWLHPWEGETALVVIAALLALGRFGRPYLRLLIPALATALPLAYYLALSRVDAAWKLAEPASSSGRPNAVLLIPALAPLLVFATLGLRGVQSRRPRDAILWLWPLGGLFVYFVSPGYSAHALEGIALPLVVLATRGWRRWGLPAWLAGLAIVAATVPGLLFDLKVFHSAAVADPQGMLLRPGERAALAYLARVPVGGGVLPSLRISAAVPAYTGRRTWIGHASWTPGYPDRAAAVTAFFSGRLTPAEAQSFLRRAGARYLLSDCEPHFDPAHLGSLVVSQRRFGCVAVYRLAIRNGVAAL